MFRQKGCGASRNPLFSFVFQYVFERLIFLNVDVARSQPFVEKKQGVIMEPGSAAPPAAPPRYEVGDEQADQQ